MTPEVWNAMAAIGAIVAAIGSLCAVWALYHTRMLDCNFLAETSVTRSEIATVLQIIIRRDKTGGPFGRITGIQIEPVDKVQVAAQVYGPIQVGLNPHHNGGNIWLPPVFSSSAPCDSPFAPTTTSLPLAFWIRSSEATEFKAVLSLEFKRFTILRKQIEIYATSIPTEATALEEAPI
ncbi:hypothetical protein [Rhodoferax sp. GW822-FHT02A01]|uniref:hypothetical protein n=1 Tax=Rhodoferax sp. GW822-FHT02A01 TaxID=3141537 RepID=UPI00315D99C3